MSGDELVDALVKSDTEHTCKGEENTVMSSVTIKHAVPSRDIEILCKHVLLVFVSSCFYFLVLYFLVRTLC